ncbi:IWS1-like protein, putative [Plasmodium gallinaceum]|uniref:IWS1-like protein, putative n=1 Tax=Plasmodium gallinaceum TaxID=5849 RepID=A0A1J1GUL0_PLAGA|nr:IWS1-like protein, putative [Plasmodium gallinaceum]CRG96138.1 IWS1-like protein, putative [Plasmodium gallinaceum]
MDINVNKNIDKSLEISNFCNDENSLEEYNEENFQEKMKLKLHVKKKQKETKDDIVEDEEEEEEFVKEEKNEEIYENEDNEEEEVKKEKNEEIFGDENEENEEEEEEEEEEEDEEEEYLKEEKNEEIFGDENEENDEEEEDEEEEYLKEEKNEEIYENEDNEEEEVKEEKNEEIFGDENEEKEEEEKIEVDMKYEVEHKNEINFNERCVGDNKEYDNYFKNDSFNNNIFENKHASEGNNIGSYDDISNEKQQNIGGTLFFDKNENDEMIESNENTVKTNVDNDDTSTELIKKKKKGKFNKKKRNLSGSESNEEKSDDTDENTLRKKKKKKMIRLKKSKYIANIAEEVEEENEEETDNGINSDNDINKKKKYSSKKMGYSDIVVDEEEYELENDDSNKLQRKKKNYFDEILENLKYRRKRAPKISEDDGIQYCENVLNQMILVHEQDIKNMKEKKPATSKLQIIDEVCKILTKPKWKPFFMKLNIYHVLALWLMPTSKNTLPNFTIRTNLLKVIQQLPITIKSLRGSQLGKIMTYLHSHKDETEENKKLIRNILQNWMGPIIGINSNYKQFLKERQKKIMENPEFHKKVLEKAKTLIPDSICIEKEEEQNEFKRHATIPYNSECSFLINVPSSMPNSSKKNIPKSKIKRLTDSMKLNKRFRKTQKVSIEGKGVAVAP